ncbi:hypothetical protein [Accumulibacter sp.]|nr:hypothetical protein [Accumulibacter sp.]
MNPQNHQDVEALSIDISAATEKIAAAVLMPTSLGKRMAGCK